MEHPSLRPGRLFLWLFAALTALLLAGCAPMVQSQPPAAQPALTDRLWLASGSPVGQTFVASYDGLSAIQVYLEPSGQGDASGSLALHLRLSPTAGEDLGLAVMPLNEVAQGGLYRFDFDPLPGSRRQYYYAFLEVDGGGSLLVGVAPGSTYLEGAVYQAHQPLDGQMQFALVYAPQPLLGGLLRQALDWAGILLIGFLLYILPGWGLTGLIWRGWHERSWPEKLGLAAGASLALYPLLIVLCDLLGLHLGAVYAWLPPAAGLAAILWRHRQAIRHPDLRAWLAGLNLKNGRLNRLGFDLLFLLVVGLVFGVRLWAIRSLDAPMWGDSLQHTMITQLLLDQGGLFDSWAPYAELDSMTYHFGFHAAAAAFGWVSGLPAVKAVLWTGQLLNGLAVLALVPLAVRLAELAPKGAETRPVRFASAIAAVLAAGLLLTMPMYYTNWGRYTQLAGLVVLPAAMLVAWELLTASSQRVAIREMALGWVLLAGLALAHYRVALFALVFILALVLLKPRRIHWKLLILRLAWLGAGALLLFTPWIWRMVGGRLLDIFAQYATTLVSAQTASAQASNTIGDLSFFLPAWAWLGLALALGLGLWQRRRGVAVMGLWGLLLLLAANPAWLHLPGTEILSGFAVFISAYVFAGTLAGAAAGWGIQAVAPLESKAGINGRVLRVGLGLAGAALVLLLAASGARQRLDDLNPMAHALVTRPDVRAAAWMRDHTPADARFLVNSFLAYEGSLAVGADGGWWLPLLAGRQISLPPISYSYETGQTDAQGLEGARLVTEEIQAKGVTHPDVLALLAQRGINYVYIGQGQGRVNYSGPYVLDPLRLASDPHFEAVYHQDRVWIFEILP